MAVKETVGRLVAVHCSKIEWWQSTPVNELGPILNLTCTGIGQSTLEWKNNQD